MPIFSNISAVTYLKHSGVYKIRYFHTICTHSVKSHQLCEYKSETEKKLVLKYLLSETINAPENGSSDTHFAKFLIPDFLKSLTYSSVCDVGVPFCRQVRWDIWSKQLAEISCDIDIEFDISSHFEFVASILVLFTWDR